MMATKVRERLEEEDRMLRATVLFLEDRIEKLRKEIPKEPVLVKRNFLLQTYLTNKALLNNLREKIKPV